ncbi:45410_t:CDS:2 [Gigaspora margarita]|uniref:45410_t:CDS:1 n=1 Tax=Gigaspora margarita TaxID=4874 RepID=A0ABN7UME2_GIGMA|nr:45410_t:CDS:2 [Gigaspora margarita]
MVNRDWNLIDKAQNVIATKAFLLRFVDREGWDMAVEIRENPIEAFFKEKLVS